MLVFTEYLWIRNVLNCGVYVCVCVCVRVSCTMYMHLTHAHLLYPQISSHSVWNQLPEEQVHYPGVQSLERHLHLYISRYMHINYYTVYKSLL